MVAVVVVSSLFVVLLLLLHSSSWSSPPLPPPKNRHYMHTSTQPSCFWKRSRSIDSRGQGYAKLGQKEERSWSLIVKSFRQCPSRH